MKRTLAGLILVLAMLAVSISVASAAPKGKMIGINVVLNTEVTDEILAELGKFGKVRDVIHQINAVTLQAKASVLSSIKALPFVAGANPDAERYAPPIDTVSVEDFSLGMNTWDLDAINVTDYSSGRTVGYDGDGVYVAVLDTGLMGTWRQYFPEERIATEYARSYSGGGGERGRVSTQPNKWGLATHPHGTHVTSTILGFSLGGIPINGVAPMVKVIPVKVLHNSGFGWSSMIAQGILHIADLKAGPLKDHPVVINMSLGGPVLDAVEKAAIDYAIAQGVIVVASAGNEGEDGMGYPGAYEPVISVAASGWTGEWLLHTSCPFYWWLCDVGDPINSEDFYIVDFSSRALTGQDLDIVAPGSWVVGPWQLQMGKTDYFYVGGTSMSSPHVAGTVALMAQKDPGLTAAEAENYLENSAIPILSEGSRIVFDIFEEDFVTISWDSDCDNDGIDGDCDPVGSGLLDAAVALTLIP
jgi:subtilisin family serine protease